MINIDKQLLYDDDYYISSVKTDSGVRLLPMTDEVSRLLSEILTLLPSKDFTVDGVSGFLFLDRKEKPMTAGKYQRIYNAIVKGYNQQKSDKLPKITPHVFRHTFATNIVSNGIQIKTLQYVMGHSNVTTSLSYYVTVSPEHVKNQLLEALS